MSREFNHGLGVCTFCPSEIGLEKGMCEACWKAYRAGWNDALDSPTAKHWPEEEQCDS